MFSSCCLDHFSVATLHINKTISIQSPYCQVLLFSESAKSWWNTMNLSSQHKTCQWLQTTSCGMLRGRAMRWAASRPLSGGGSLCLFSYLPYQFFHQFVEKLCADVRHRVQMTCNMTFGDHHVGLLWTTASAAQISVYVLGGVCWTLSAGLLLRLCLCALSAKECTKLLRPICMFSTRVWYNKVNGLATQVLHSMQMSMIMQKYIVASLHCLYKQPQPGLRHADNDQSESA